MLAAKRQQQIRFRLHGKCIQAWLKESALANNTGYANALQFWLGVGIFSVNKLIEKCTNAAGGREKKREIKSLKVEKLLEQEVYEKSVEI